MHPQSKITGCVNVLVLIPICEIKNRVCFREEALDAGLTDYVLDPEKPSLFPHDEVNK
jgi:hypothetical protein